MKKTSQFVRKYPLSLFCLATIWVLSLVPVFPETPLDNVDFIDKWVHTAMYGGTCLVIWWEYWRSHRQPNYRRLLVWAWLAPTLMGGLLELLQEYCTGGCRNGDWLDFAANTTGVTLAALVGLALVAFGNGGGKK